MTIQLDFFWSFAMGASMAACGYKKLRRSHQPFINGYFLFAILCQTMVFAPMGSFFLHFFTDWETMFWYNQQTMPAWFYPLWIFSGLGMCIAGFMCTYAAIQSRNNTLMHMIWVGGYCAAFALAGFGLDRHTYAGTMTEWHRGKHYSLASFLFSPVFGTFSLAMLMAWPLLIIAMRHALSQQKISPEEKKRHRADIRISITFWLSALSLAYLTFVAFASPEVRAKMAFGHSTLGVMAPLVEMLQTQAMMLPLALSAYMFLPIAGSKMSKLDRIFTRLAGNLAESHVVQVKPTNLGTGIDGLQGPQEGIETSPSVDVQNPMLKADVKLAELKDEELQNRQQEEASAATPRLRRRRSSRQQATPKQPIQDMVMDQPIHSMGG